MDRSFPTSPYWLEEPRASLRSPSRLDFCMEDLGCGGTVLETRGDSGTHAMDCACTPFHDDRQGALVVDGVRPDCSPLPIVKDEEEDPPKGMDPHSRGHADASDAPPPVPRECPIDRFVIEPQSPRPVRPFLVQFDPDVQERRASRTAPQRLDYPHHGFSRSALLQQKTLWNSRHEEWVEWQSRMEQGEARKQESDAYTGLANVQPCVVEGAPPYMRSPPSGMERDVAGYPPRKPEQNVHAPIFPRVGDISALRDPYSANIDRCFFRFPLWTLQKMLYTFDMHQRTGLLAPSAYVCNTGCIQESASSSTLSSYSSSALGDEGSDTTLVADDSPIPASQLPLEALRCDSGSDNLSLWNCHRGWDLSWYARWELLVGLFQRDRAKCDDLDMSMKLAVPAECKVAASSAPATIVIGFTVESGGKKEQEEEEDYGMVVPDPTFNVNFEEECERAMAFYGRESRYSEMVLV